MGRDRAYLRHRLVRGFAWSLAGRAGGSLASLAVGAALARLLSPADLGTYFLILSFVSVVVILAQLGLPRTTVRFIAESMGRNAHFAAADAITKTLLLGFVGAAFTGFLVITLGPHIVRTVLKAQVLMDLLPLASLWLIVLALQGLMSEIYRGFHQIREASTIGPFSTSMVAALVLWVLYLGGKSIGVVEAIVIHTLASLLTIAIGVALLARRWLSLRRGRQAAPIPLRSYLTVGWPLLVTSLALFVLSQADVWILNYFESTTEVAQYSVAARLVGQIAVPLAIANAFLPPLIAELHSTNQVDILEETIRFTSSIAAIPSALVLLLYIAGGAQVLEILFGPFYREVAPVLLVLSVGQMFSVAAGSAGLVLSLTGHQMDLMKISLGVGFGTLALGVWLAQAVGTLGVATAIAIGVIAQNVLMLLQAKRRCAVWTHMYFSPVRIKKAIADFRDAAPF